MVADGARVLVITSLADASGAAAIEVAQQEGIPVIEYDRLTSGGRANFYVGPDPATLGRILGEGLLRCMQDSGNENGPVALLNGPGSDSSAMALKQGYLQPIQSAGYAIRASEDVPGWDPGSGGALFERMYTMSNGDLVGVIAADDGLAEAAVAVLERNDRDGQIPVVGPGASEAALGRVLLGQQCMTVLTSVLQEADATARLAAAIVDADGGAIASIAAGQLVDASSGIVVPSALLEPQPIFPQDVKAVVEAGLVSAARMCAPEELLPICRERGILG
jgi:D-xylose transport system substrate-binding protein